MCALDVLSATLGRAAKTGRLRYDVFTRVITPHLKGLDAAWGSCGRVRSTPIPYVYQLLLRLTLFFYLASLPIFMLPQGLFGILGITIVLGLLLLMIEEVGFQVQNPFGYDLSDLPLEEYVEGVVEELAQAHARYCDPQGGGVREHATVSWRLSRGHVAMLSSRGTTRREVGAGGRKDGRHGRPIRGASFIHKVNRGLATEYTRESSAAHFREEGGHAAAVDTAI